MRGLKRLLWNSELFLAVFPACAGTEGIEGEIAALTVGAPHVRGLKALVQVVEFGSLVLAV